MIRVMGMTALVLRVLVANRRRACSTSAVRVGASVIYRFYTNNAAYIDHIVGALRATWYAPLQHVCVT